MSSTKYKFDPTYKVGLRLDGKFAHWATPAGGVERHSYPYPTYGQMAGAVRNIFWKPEIEWHVRSVSILNPVQWYDYTTNGVKKGAGTAGKIMPFNIDDGNHTQRQNTILFDVSYLVIVSPCLVGTGVSHAPDKYVAQLRRRIERGQCFKTPFLGRNQYSAKFSKPSGNETPIPVTENLYSWFIGWDGNREQEIPRFANLKIENGKIEYDFNVFKATSKYLKG